MVNYVQLLISAYIELLIIGTIYSLSYHMKSFNLIFFSNLTMILSGKFFDYIKMNYKSTSGEILIKKIPQNILSAPVIMLLAKVTFLYNLLMFNYNNIRFIAKGISTIKTIQQYYINFKRIRIN